MGWVSSGIIPKKSLDCRHCGVVTLLERMWPRSEMRRELTVVTSLLLSKGKQWVSKCMTLMLPEKEDLSTNSSLVKPPMKENGREDSVMVKANSAGLMELSMKVFGRIIVLMEEANSLILMGTSTKATGLMTKLTVLEFTLMSTELGMKAPGKMIYNVAMERKAGLTAVYTKESI